MMNEIIELLKRHPDWTVEFKLNKAIPQSADILVRVVNNQGASTAYGGRSFKLKLLEIAGPNFLLNELKTVEHQMEYVLANPPNAPSVL